MKSVRNLFLAIIIIVSLNRCKQHQPNLSEKVDASTTQNFDTAKMEPGITLIDNDRWQSFLVNAEGKTLHTFRYGLVQPLRDGNYAGREDTTLVKYDSQMKVLWKTPVPLDLHHSISSDESGNIYLLATHVHRFMGLDVRFDVVKGYSANGDSIFDWCVYDHLKEFLSVVSKSKWLEHLPRTFAQCKSMEEYIEQDPGRFIIPTNERCGCDFEFTHFTSVQALLPNGVEDKIPAFKSGNLLVCFNPYSAYGIINPHSGKIEWASYLTERTRLHSPTLTMDGTILVFQNNTDSMVWANKHYSEETVAAFQKRFPKKINLPDPHARNWASVDEYDPLTGEKIWEYTGTPKELFQSPHMGSAERLANGNTLICTGTKNEGGRVIELTRDKKIVWDYRSAEKNADDTLPLRLYRATRISTTIMASFITPFK